MYKIEGIQAKVGLSAHPKWSSPKEHHSTRLR